MFLAIRTASVVIVFLQNGVDDEAILRGSGRVPIEHAALLVGDGFVPGWQPAEQIINCDVKIVRDPPDTHQVWSADT